MKLSELYRKARETGRSDLMRFMRDMKRAGLRIQEYHGRWYWHGPAVVADGLQDVLSRTRVPCQWDSMGRGVVVYPRQGL